MELSCTVQRETKLLSVLRRELRLSDGLVRRLKAFNAFSVNGAIAHTDCVLHVGDTVTARMVERPPAFPPEDGALEILYEDEALLVVDKPSGILVHPSASRLCGTLANRIYGYYVRTGQDCAVHILTRLDRDTAGVVIYAKNAYVHSLLIDALQRVAVEKTYLAAVIGAPAQDAGIIDLPIARLSAQSLLRCVRADGARAVTEYRVLERKNGYALLSLHPLTGRTHQLRIHCSASGFPILGDPQYGGGEGGQQLLAAQIALTHPLYGTPLQFTSRQHIALPDEDRVREAP